MPTPLIHEENSAFADASDRMKKAERDKSLADAIESHQGKLRSVIRKSVRDQSEVDDVMQEVFEEYVESYDLGVAIETLGAWLVRVAQNKILDRFRRQKTRQRHEDEVVATTTEEEASASRPDSEWTNGWIRKEIIDALELLPEEQRDVFVKNELEGKSFEEIAAETGVSINTLLSRKRYAVKFLRTRLKEIYDELE